MKTQTTSSKPQSKGGLASRLNIASWRKLHVATMTADEEAWPQREPSGNLGRIFVLLLLLHVFIIGAVVIYNIMTPKNAVAKTDTAPAATDKAKAGTPTKSVATTRSTLPVPAPSGVASNTDSKPLEIANYEVRSGDNVPGIVAKLGISAEDLIKQNNLDSTDLYPGRKLHYTKKPVALPVALAPAQGVTFTAASNASKPNALKAGDSSLLSNTLPKKNDTLINGDSLPKAILVKGPPVDHADTPPSPAIKVKEDTGTSAKPKGDTAKTAQSSANKTKDTTGKRTYVVTSKDTLYSIAKKYGVKVSALQKANDIKDPTTLKNGTRLIIPSKN